MVTPRFIVDHNLSNYRQLVIDFYQSIRLFPLKNVDQRHTLYTYGFEIMYIL